MEGKEEKSGTEEEEEGEGEGEEEKVEGGGRVLVLVLVDVVSLPGRFGEAMMEQLLEEEED